MKKYPVVLLKNRNLKSCWLLDEQSLNQDLKISVLVMRIETKAREDSFLNVVALGFIENSEAQIYY